MTKNLIFFISLFILLFSCKKEKESNNDNLVIERCNSKTKDSLLGTITLKDLKNLIKEEPGEINKFMSKNCFTKTNLGKIVYVNDTEKVDSLKIKNNKQGVFFFNKVTAIDISQEIVYKLTYNFPIKYLNSFVVAIEKESKKGRFHKSNSITTNETYKATYEINRWDNKKIKNSYSYQIDTYNGFAKLTIFFSEDLPVD